MELDNAEGSSVLQTDLSPEQRSVLVGTLLGDGCLAKHGRFHRLHIKHKAAHAALAEYKRKVLDQFVSMNLHRFEQRLGQRRYPCVQFATRTHPVFTEWHRRFYRGRRKIVPHDIAWELSPLALAVWLMDDGAADYSGVTFQTHSFRLEEVELLATALERRLGLAVNPRANRGGWILYVRAESLDDLRKMLQPHLLAGFEYKLEPRRSRTP